MKGIVLAGGTGTRLYPATLALCKQLLPIYDKPMIYYPLSLLLLAGIREILIISTREDIPRFQKLFGDGSFLGVSIEYAIQERPAGIADALLVGASFIGETSVALVLGDNLLYGEGLSRLLQEAASLQEGALVFGYRVKDPRRYGVISFDEEGRATAIEEKPQNPTSPYAVPGLYFYDRQAVLLTRELAPSPRGELEITDLSRLYLERGELKVKVLGRGVAWLDTGTVDALNEASLFVQVMEERQGVKIGCLEEVAFRMGYISQIELLLLAKRYPNGYGDYLRQVARDAQLLQPL